MPKQDLAILIGGLYMAYLIALIIVLHNDGYSKRWIFILDLVIPFGGLVRVLIKAIFYDFVKTTTSKFKELE